MRGPWYNSKWAVRSFHVIGWMLWFCIPILFRRDSEQGQVIWSHVFNLPNIISNICWVIVFYSNANFLVPRYLNKRKYWRYAGILLMMFIPILFIMNFVFQLNKNTSVMVFHRLPYFLFFPFIVVWAVSTVYRVLADKIKTDQLIKDKENENLKTELSFLRSQVSPHFLFNVLNNMVALARLKSDRLEPSLIKLSGLMRYMLYESDEQKVPLSKEIEYVTSYIDLQRLRFGKDMAINTRFDSNGDYHLIEPMLLIPFIENAFKHGTGLIQHPEIDICLKVVEGKLLFTVRNKYNGDSNEIKDKTSGIGLVNVERRLNLLYGKDYLLDIKKAEGFHTVSLQLNLQ
ncbi:MAG: sensor histidine kinase [Chitinophagales bacterium]